MQDQGDKKMKVIEQIIEELSQYSSLKEAAKAQAIEQEKLIKKTVVLGNLLIALREETGKARFMQVIHDRLPFSERTALDLVKIAKAAERGRPAAKLTKQVYIALELFPAPEKRERKPAVPLESRAGAAFTPARKWITEMQAVTPLEQWPDWLLRAVKRELKIFVELDHRIGELTKGE
jgi:hypothetical protein